MVYNTKTKTFEEKKVKVHIWKTKFTVVIFSEKGTKQAGEVYLNVADFLNSQAKSIHTFMQNNRFKRYWKSAQIKMQN